MSISLRSRMRRMLIGASVAICAVALSGATALADTELGHAGTPGEHRLNDTFETPGAQCNYTSASGGYDLKAIKVFPPVMFARDTTDQRDAQRTGWRFFLERAEPAPGPAVHSSSGVAAEPVWERFYKSGVQKARAYDDTPAVFAPIKRAQSFPDGLNYRVVIKMFWYRPNGTVHSTATHLVDFYRWHFDDQPGIDIVDGPQGSCRGVLIS